ncbi:helix-turn-helix transcriptional regulator [Lutibacter sp. TH_r2]|uniref:helix-turn-helix domain-containing protein n=1 Tax=Lutibacter sp. TH_r2 TaxID=3082083 RepID=UPI00295433CF|nr:helix-turn-helix transcriptional regulator [Lutibacter sp. TH_r2]MDV7187896.1 helix-turn-helix transcriptional regulator [Lutibacter sp. TH_r2]
MLSINLTEVNSRLQIAKVIRKKMRNNGITKSDLSKATHLSKTAINELLASKADAHDFRFGTLIKVLEFLNIKLFIGKNEEGKSKVLSLFNVSE